MPLTSSRSSTLLNLPTRVRCCTILSARAGPMPGSSSSSARVALFSSSMPPRPRPSVLGAPCSEERALRPAGVSPRPPTGVPVRVAPDVSRSRASSAEVKSCDSRPDAADRLSLPNDDVDSSCGLIASGRSKSERAMLKSPPPNRQKERVRNTSLSSRVRKPALDLRPDMIDADPADTPAVEVVIPKNGPENVSRGASRGFRSHSCVRASDNRRRALPAPVAAGNARDNLRPSRF